MLKQVLSRCWLAIPGGIAGVTLAAQWRELPSAAFWDDRDAWVWAAVLVVAVVAITEPVRNATHAALDERRERRANSVEKLLHLCLIETDRLTSEQLAYYDIGVHVWEVRWRLRRKLPFIGKRLVKLDHIRLSDTLGRSRVEWTKGKGVIGQCWEQSAKVSRNLDEFTGYDNAKEWDAEDEGFRLKLSWEEYQRTKSYGGVLAAPMFGEKDDRFRGCVSLDAPTGSFGTLDGDDVRDVLMNTANAIAGQLYDEKAR